MGKTSLDWAHEGKAGATVENRVLRSIVRRACVAVAEDVTIGPAVQRGVVTEEEVVEAIRRRPKANSPSLSLALVSTATTVRSSTAQRGGGPRFIRGVGKFVHV